MKEHNMSQSIAPPATIPITYDALANELMTDWLAERVQRAIEIVLDAASQTGLSLKCISVIGHDYYDNSYRQIFIWVSVDAPHTDAYDYWGVVAGPIHALNQPPPPQAVHADVKLEVSVESL